ncbi:RNA polymerase sigma factor [Flavobacterium agricola]|uniref:RNA polymerase sigma factor n=1 Tax=Flavobacterium agricola TaxID=2870839 RepID=A0ABY6M3R0_9FLAO|nr:RNA polymerase sigma factor [Flavobacterium agricola]UYW02562.1 RNA polymerase sigma factor [Flavobacterium agricola]
MQENEKQFINELLSPKTQNQAFKKLIGLYKVQLYHHIRNIVLNHDDTDDVLQNTFIKVFSNLDSFNQESKLSTWLYRIATNEALNHLNSKARKNGLQTDEITESAATNLHSDLYFDGDEVQRKLQQAINTLPEKQKLVFNMKYFQDLKYEEIAQILNTSVGGLKASYHLAVKKIETFFNSD